MKRLFFEKNGVSGEWTKFNFGNVTMFYDIEIHEDEKYDLWRVRFGSISGDYNPIVIFIGVGLKNAKQAAQDHFENALRFLTKDRE
ncbi:MAG: hypothetical protein ACEQSB_00580 [Undibacterium sp.]